MHERTATHGTLIADDPFRSKRVEDFVALSADWPENTASDGSGTGERMQGVVTQSAALRIGAN